MWLSYEDLYCNFSIVKEQKLCLIVEVGGDKPGK